VKKLLTAEFARRPVEDAKKSKVLCGLCGFLGALCGQKLS
jgi:hypothetical protein